MKEALRNEDVDALAQVFFNFKLAPTQLQIVKDIIFHKVPRISISAMTRYGKSQLIAVAIGLYLMLNRNKKIFFIAPTREQAAILRNYLNDLVLSCPFLLDASDIDTRGSSERLKKEVSKSRVTFKNGCEYRVFSAHQDGSGLMGHGVGKDGGFLIIDEATKISREAFAKIMRMLGDNPEMSQIAELYNPWDRDNKAYEHSIDETWVHYHIDWRTAVKEGRTSEHFVEQQKRELTGIEFEVLYESKFPETSEDSIFRFVDVQNAIELHSEIEPPTEEDGFKRIISCDVADKGLDLTVIMYGYHNEETGLYILEDIYSEEKSENMQVAGKIIQWANEKGADKINIDTIGVGVGVVSRVREVLGDEITVNACHYGEGVGTAGKDTKPHKYEHLIERRSDSAKKRFSNRKAEQFFRLKDLLEEGLIAIPRKKELTTELMNMKWELTSSGKIKVVDPERSPNFADALVYFIWGVDEDEVILDFTGPTGGVQDPNVFTI